MRPTAADRPAEPATIARNRFSWRPLRVVLVLAGVLACGCHGPGPTTVPPPGFRSRSVRLDTPLARRLAQSAATGEAASGELPSALPSAWEPAGASRPWTHLVLHHTATESGSVASIDQVHRTRTDGQGKPWLGIGYHFVIGNGRGMADGAIEPTFRWARQLQGAHAGDADLNASAIGICLVGDFNQAPPSGRQIASARRLVEALRIRYGIGLAEVVAHGQVKATDCPGRLFPWQDVVGAAPPDDPQAGSRLGSTMTFSRYD